MIFGWVDLHLFQESVSDAFWGDAWNLIGSYVDNPPLIWIHKIQDFILTGLLNLLGDLLSSFFELPLLSLAEKITVGLYLFLGKFIEQMLQSQKQRAIFSEQQILIRAIEDEIQEIARSEPELYL